MADLLKRELGVEVSLVEGNNGEFTVWIDGKLVAKKGWIRFPQDDKVLLAVRQALGS